MKLIKQYSTLGLFIALTGCGAALSLKAAIGVGPWDALAQSISFLTFVKVGTIGMIMNISCVGGQLIFSKGKFDPKVLLQIPVALVLGSLINFVYYDVLGTLVIDSYWVRFILLLVSTSIIAISVSGIMELGLVTFALEGFCMVLSDRFSLRFAHLRQAVDILSVIIVIGLTVVFKIPPTLREGTIISMMLFGPMLAFFMPRINIVLSKYDLVTS